MAAALASRSAVAATGGKPRTEVANPLMARTGSTVKATTDGGFATAAAFTGKMKRSVAKVEQAAIVVSRARALEHVEMTHPRIPGTVHTVKIKEPLFTRDKETGKLRKVSRRPLSRPLPCASSLSPSTARVSRLRRRSARCRE